jgi:hypothetical protein
MDEAFRARKHLVSSHTLLPRICAPDRISKRMYSRNEAPQIFLTTIIYVAIVPTSCTWVRHSLRVVTLFYAIVGTCRLVIGRVLL